MKSYHSCSPWNNACIFVTNAPLEPCIWPLHLINISPFVINGKGIFPFGADPPNWLVWYPNLKCPLYGASSCTSKTYKTSIHFGVEITPSLCKRYSKASRGSGFVNISSTCSFVPTYSTLMFFSATCSHRKWYLIGMCFVLECITEFFEYWLRLYCHNRLEWDHHTQHVYLS